MNIVPTFEYDLYNSYLKNKNIFKGRIPVFPML